MNRCRGRAGAPWQRPRIDRCAPGAAWALLGAAVFLAAAAPAWAAQTGSPAGAVPVDRLEARRAALLDRIGTGVAVLRSAEPHDLEGDYPQDSDFRQDNDFFYLTGLETSGSWLVLVAREDEPDQTILYLPARDPGEERWTGATLGPGAEASRRTGIRDVRSAEVLPSEIVTMAEASTAPARTRGVRLEAGRAELSELESSLERAGVAVHDLRPDLAALRLVKDADEQARLRRAIEITGEAQREAMRAAAPGLWEYELEALIEYTFRRRGAERVGFPSIVGSGPNSTVLHYDESRRRMEAGDLVVVDVGAEFGYYTADVTRTFPVSGRFTPRQRALYELVLGAQRAAIDAVRPGITIPELDRVARAYMRERSDTLCGADSCDRYFVHGLSHWLGMDVHDVGDYSTPLEPGMVFTIEPGLYLSEEAIGIRIEDDVLVAAEGAVVLSDHSPREPDAIEALMAEAPRCCVIGAEAGR